MWASGFGIQSLGLGFRVWAVGFGVESLGSFGQSAESI